MQDVSVAPRLADPTDLDPGATIMSIDGVGAYDQTPRNAMLEGFLKMDGGNQTPPL